jgi:hypothetical protein
MKTVIKVLTMALCVAALSFGAIIDDFSVNHASLQDNTANSIPVNRVVVVGGVSRTMSTNFLSGNTSTTAEIIAGYFYGGNATDAVGNSGASYFNAGLWDLSSIGTFLNIDVQILEGYTGGQIQFFVGQGANSASTTLSVPNIGTILASLDSFTGIGGVNRAQIDTIGFVFLHDPVGSQDIRLDNFGTTIIPEPGTYALMAVGLLGLFAIRRKRA